MQKKKENEANTLKVLAFGRGLWTFDANINIIQWLSIYLCSISIKWLVQGCAIICGFAADLLLDRTTTSFWEEEEEKKFHRFHCTKYYPMAGIKLEII